MSKLPPARFRPRPPAERDRLARWLADWRLDRMLPELAADAPARPGEPVVYGRTATTPSSAASPCDTEVAVGEIRLLKPRPAGLAERLLYVAVLEVAGPASFAVALFSRFNEPAWPGEFLTGRPARPLRVLGAGNPFTLPARLLAESWIISRLSQAELTDARAVLHRATEPLAPSLVARLGPPLRHPLDPRWDYLNEERAVADSLERSAEADDGYRGTIPFPATEELALAAETRGAYRTPRRLAVRGLSAWLTVGEPDASGELTLRAVDAAGQSVATLDGARLKTPDGQLSAPIRAGTLQVAGPLPATGVQLLLPDGRCLPLDPVGKPAA